MNVNPGYLLAIVATLACGLIVISIKGTKILGAFLLIGSAILVIL